MAQRSGRSVWSGDGPGKHGVGYLGAEVFDAGTGTSRPGSVALLSQLARPLSYLGDTPVDRLMEAATAETRRSDRQDG